MTRPAAGRWYRGARGPQLRRRSLLPVGAHPCSLRRSVHAARCHPAPDPGSGSHLRPRAAGPSAACGPSGLPPRPAGPRTPRRALAAQPPCDRPKLADGALGASRRRTGLGALPVTLAHPFPEETLAGREQRALGPLNLGGPRPPSGRRARSRPAGEGVAPAPP